MRQFGRIKPSDETVPNQGAVTGSSSPIRRPTSSARRPRLANLPWSCGAAEPVVETRRADARVVPRREGLIVHVYAEVASMDVCDYLTGVVLGAQEPPDQFVEA